MANPKTFLILGAGSRGVTYGEYAIAFPEKAVKIDTRETGEKVMQGHGGGDFGIMDNFVTALIKNDPSIIISGAEETIESHRMVFMAEEARKKNIVINM